MENEIRTFCKHFWSISSHLTCLVFTILLSCMELNCASDRLVDGKKKYSVLDKLRTALKYGCGIIVFSLLNLQHFKQRTRRKRKKMMN